MLDPYDEYDRDEYNEDESGKDQNRVWEPMPLELGAVVRVRLSGECQLNLNNAMAVRGGVIDIDVPTPHPRACNNKIGVIIQVNRADTTDGHYYTVFFTSLADNGVSDLMGGDFASTELEYVDRHISQDEWKFITNYMIRFRSRLPTTLTGKWRIMVPHTDEDGNEGYISRCWGSSLSTHCYGHKT